MNDIMWHFEVNSQGYTFREWFQRAPKFLNDSENIYRDAWLAGFEPQTFDLDVAILIQRLGIGTVRTKCAECRKPWPCESAKQRGK